MCYSATASFTLAVLLFVIGFFTYREGRGTNYWLLSLIPIVFATHQFIEGIVWLTVNGVVSEAVGQVATYVYLAIANMVWPGFVALASFWSETVGWRRRYMRNFVRLGVIWAAALGVVLVTYSGSYAASGGHISYNFISPSFWILIIGFTVYAGTGLIPLFLSSNNHIRYLGGMFFVSGLVTLVVAAHWLTSIWCFWAAILSSYIYYIVRWQK